MRPDKRSMEDIYQNNAKTVYRYLMSLTRNEDLAEELTQETFYQAIRSIERFDGSSRMSTWLCAIAKNVLFTYRRKHPEHEDITELGDLAGSAGSAEESAVGAESRMELLKKLHSITEPHREVIYLRVFGGLSFREIGEIHGKTENWARVTFYRGKEKLRKEVQDEE